MRRALPLLLALLASCGEGSSQLPTGPLRLHRDGMLRVGNAEAPDAAPIFKARAAEGPVSVEIDPDASVDGAARLFAAAEDAGLASVEFVVGSEKLKLLMGSRPATPASLPPMPRPAEAEIERTVVDVRLVGRPDRSEVHMRVLRLPPVERVKAVKESVAEIGQQIGAPRIVLAIEAPRSMPWSRLAPLVAAAGEALGERLVRHELVAAP